jgi:hypothetical protein
MKFTVADPAADDYAERVVRAGDVLASMRETARPESGASVAVVHRM